jgi:hypothetical protein
VNEDQVVERIARNREALTVGRPPGTSPGWTVWHQPSGLQAIQPVRYKRDAEAARAELLATFIDWTLTTPNVADEGGDRADYAAIYYKYRALRQKQLNNNSYWPRTIVREPAS